jgi:hypothetical protein
MKIGGNNRKSRDRKAFFAGRSRSLEWSRTDLPERPEIAFLRRFPPDYAIVGKPSPPMLTVRQHPDLAGTSKG